MTTASFQHSPFFQRYLNLEIKYTNFWRCYQLWYKHALFILADIVIFLSCKIWACMWRFYGKNITIPPENLHFYKLEWELSPDFHSHTLLNNGDPGTQASPPGTLCGWGTNPLALGKSPYNLLQTMQCHLYNSKDFFLFIITEFLTNLYIHRLMQAHYGNQCLVELKILVHVF